MNINKASNNNNMQYIQVRSNHRNDLTQVEKGDYCRYFKVKGLHRHYDLYKAIGNYNESANNSLKKCLRTLLIESNHNISQLNRKQDKMFDKYKNLDDIKHKIFFTEYQQQLEYLREKLMQCEKYKNLREDEILELDIYKKTKAELKDALIRRFQLDEEFQSYALIGRKCSTPRQLQFRSRKSVKDIVDSVNEFSSHSLPLPDKKTTQKKSVDFKLPELTRSTTINAIEKVKNENTDKYVANKRLSLVVVQRKQEKNVVCAYKLDAKSNLVEIDAPKRKDFRLHLDKMKQFKMQKTLDAERAKLNSFEMIIENQEELNQVEFEYDDSDEEETETENQVKQGKKNKRKRNKKKKNKKNENSNQQQQKQKQQVDDDLINTEDEKVEIEYIPEEIDFENKNFGEYKAIFERFKLESVDNAEKKSIFSQAGSNKDVERLKYKLLADEDDEEFKQKKEEKEAAEAANNPVKLSKKQLKKVTRLSVAELKQLVQRPDVVEMHDITARDPKLLVDLKSTRNSVPVPRHWCAKRKYLQGKRGVEKPAFDLPDYIKRTGITEMRGALAEKEQGKSLKQKMREKVRPKMGKIDIDYQKLHDAFFRYQTKPRMSIHGDLYYEGKEFETRLREKKPGNISDDLRIALGMPTGLNADKVPPPWLIAQQRYGPPPSYPNLKIPGLNAPIPEHCTFGYHAGGWGKPPVDEFGRPLYGDVFGATLTDHRLLEEEEQIDKQYWGELEPEEYNEPMYDENSSDEEQEEEQESEEAMESQAAASGMKTPSEGLITPSGLSTNVSAAGLETPDMIELRKKKIESEMDDSETPVLYKVLPEKPVSVGSSMMGSSKVYDISNAKKVTAGEDIDIALNPDELDMDNDTLQARYQQQLKERQSGTSTTGADKEDLSEMVADHAAKQNKKRKKQQETQPSGKDDKDKGAKKKEFKF